MAQQAEFLEETVMGTFAVTGAASGMGAQSAAQLRAEGHQVITVDLKAADVVADLSTPEGRRTAIAAVLERAGGRLDGAVLAAGLGPTPGLERVRLLLQVNYFGAVELLEGWRPALAAADKAKVVVFGSNSTTTMPLIPKALVKGLLAGDYDKAFAAAKRMGKNAPSFAYGGSKAAVMRWVRRMAVTDAWIGQGIRLNAIAPGAVLTPLLQKQLDTPDERAAIEGFPLPVGHFADPVQLARWVAFMCSDAADFLCGSVILVDGGSEAYFRADDWPTSVPLRGLSAYLRRSKAWKAKRGLA